MKRTGAASLPLHSGKAPRWLFGRMVLLAEAISEVMVYEYGKERLLHTLSDPFWFQALSCVLGFDWHSSGTTTVTCGALKEALKSLEHGMYIAGGKGKASRKTLEEIELVGDVVGLNDRTIDELKLSSRLTAKVDNAALQDGYILYHHVIAFTEEGKWAVIQQGMSENTTYARRYHWRSDKIKSYVEEPHDAILGYTGKTLDMTAHESKNSRKLSVDIVNDNPQHLKREWHVLRMPSWQTTLEGVRGKHVAHLEMPRSINWQALRKVYEIQPRNYEELIGIKGVGPSTIRALAFIAEVIYGVPSSWKDPVKYSFAVGGKDGVPYPVDKIAMDRATSILKRGVKEAKIGEKEKLCAIRRLMKFVPEQ